MKEKIIIWLKKLTERNVRKTNRDILTFVFFLLLSFIFWYLNSLGKNIESNVRYPLRYINIPKERVLAGDLPSKLDIALRGPGYSILKLKLADSRTPVVLDMSIISYRRVPGSRTLSYFILTSGLIPKLRNQLRSECDIVSISPDTLFFTYDRIVSREVPVKPDIEISTERQYLVSGDITTVPDSVKVTGPSRIIDTLRYVNTKVRKFSDLDKTIKKTINLDLHNEYSASVRKVTITIPVEQFTEAEIKVPVQIIDKPDSIDIKIFPDVVTVRYLVAISDFKRLAEAPFEVVLDLRNTDLMSSEKIPVEIRNIPSFVRSVSITPAKVDFLIEKRHK